MESEPIRCQWRHCEKNAVKHAAFGLRVFDARSDIHVSDTAYETEHLDLCAKHIDLISLQYIHVTEYELRSCPKHPSNIHDVTTDP